MEYAKPFSNGAPILGHQFLHPACGSPVLPTLDPVKALCFEYFAHKYLFLNILRRLER